MKFPKGIVKTNRPKINDNMVANTRGRFWEPCPVTLPDGVEIWGWYDKGRGTYFYFEYENQWYKGLLDDFDNGMSRFHCTPNLTKRQEPLIK